MKTVSIPRTDLTPSQICLGTSVYGSEISREDSFALMDAFAEHGGSFFDSARVYADWLPGGKNASERTLGEWVKATGQREQWVIATKGGHPDLKSMHVSRLSPAEIEADVETSLRWLQMDYIDLYWLHRDDPAVPVEAIVETLNRVAQQGKIRCFGGSNWTVKRLRAANEYAAQHGLQGFVANQPMWSLALADLDSLADKTLVAMDVEGMGYHRETNMAAIPYSSQARGYFTKMAAEGTARLSKHERRLYDSEINHQRLQRALALAKQYGVTVTDIALSYLTSQPFPTIPIIGCRTMTQLRDTLKACDLTLTPAEVQALEA